MTIEKKTGKRYDRNRQAILDAARGIIAEQGLDALSIRNLAEGAEYSPSTLYRYFHDKEEILDTLARQAWRLAAEKMPSLPGDVSALDVVLQSGMHIYQFACQHPMEYSLMVSSTSSSPKSMQGFMEDEKFMGVRTFLTEAQQNKTLNVPRGFNIDLLALLLWFTVHGAAMMRIGLMHEFHEEVDQWMDQLLKAFNQQLSMNP